VDQIYCQVFFDSAYATNVLKIFEIIGSGESFTIESPAKSQQKATMFIPITYGTQVGLFDEAPAFEVEHQTTLLGRHDVYVRPVRGSITIDAEALRGACAEPKTLR